MRKLRFTYLALVLTTACDFDQLHNPNKDATTTTGGSGGEAGAAGTGSGGAGSGSAGSTGSGGATTTTSAATTTGTAGNGAGGAATGSGGGGAATTGSGGAGVGGGAGAGGTGGGGTGTGGAMLDASNGGAGGSGLADASPDGAPCIGYALQFNGTSSYAMVNRAVQNDFTLEAWVKPSANLPPLTGTNIWNGYGILYADLNTTTNDFGTSIVNGKFAFGVGNPDTNVQSAGSIPNGQWTHVAATRTMATGAITVIVNGVMDGTKTTTQTGALSAPPSITIGADILDGHYFNGLIDEVRFWSVARTPAEIAATMNTRLTGTEPGLVGYYRLDEGTGTTMVDSSPTQASGTLSGGDAGPAGAPTWTMSDLAICP